MKKITIVWGTDKEDKKTYEFKTDEQLKYFMMGVDEGNGWLEYEIEENYAHLQTILMLTQLNVTYHELAVTLQRTTLKI